jgi:CheY-like chemotaxis protein
MTAAILIVEDHPDEAKLLEEMLGQLGVTDPICHVHSAVEAIAYFQGDYPYSNRERFPLPKTILLDLRLPGMSGFEFMKWLQTGDWLKDLRVIVVSGLDGVAAIRHAYSLGATSFLPKPYTFADLQNLIRFFPDYLSQSYLQKSCDTANNPNA